MTINLFEDINSYVGSSNLDEISNCLAALINDSCLKQKETKQTLNIHKKKDKGSSNK